jgi:hypothetical protein
MIGSWNMKIIDAFTFLNEVDLVKARLEYLNDIVTDFVIVESNQTWRHQRNKPFFHQVLKTLPEKIKNKIHYVVAEWPDDWLEDPVGVQEKWVENGTREHALYEIKKFGDPEDWIIMNDLDEFWDIELWNQAVSLYQQHGQLVWLQSNRTCFVDWETTSMPEWPGSKMAKLKDISSMEDFYCSKNKALRITPGKNEKSLFHPITGGWHFTKMGNMETKAKSMGSIREWRSWETKIGKSPEEAAKEIFYGNGWNSIAKKGKMKAEYVGEKKITPALLKILKEYKVFWSNGLDPNGSKP